MKFGALVPFHLLYQITLRRNQDFSRGREMGVVGRDVLVASEQQHHCTDFYETLHECSLAPRK